jgi:phosphoribosylformylglycinamidine synthase
MSVGIVKEGETALATSHGAGNPVYIVGASTGKDGIHGAASASKDISEESVKDFSAVPKGNPLLEKALMEASLEVIKTGAVIGMQDMGAAGIICSNSEMSAKGKHGMRIDLNKVPLREEDMQAFEILLSESQERMLIVAKKGREAQIEAIFEKWDVNCDYIGDVTDTGRLEYYFNNELVADVPADDLVLGGGAPVYERNYKEPTYFKEYKKFEIENVEIPTDLRDVAQHLIAHPNIASKRWVINQYDTKAGGINLTANKFCDAAVVSIEGTNKAIALTVDCNARYVKADPQKGAAIAVAEAARNIVCAGGESLAITNCLNFGNPYHPEVYWQFVEAIKGMSEACLKFNIPITGGNVSFYNQSSDEKAVFPTPTIGMLGLLEDVSTLMTLDFKAKDDYIYLIGESVNDISSSQYLASYHKIEASPAPYFDFEKEFEMHQVMKELINKKLIASAHDVSDGGLYIALLESAMPNNFGFAIESDSALRKDAFLFGEAQGRVIVSVKPENRNLFVETMAASTVDFTYLGVVSSSGNVVDDEMYDTTAHAKSIYDHVLNSYLGEV